MTGLSFQEIIFRLQSFWSAQGCAILQPYDLEVGAGTFHPATFLYALGPKPWNAAFVQPSRRPADGRYGDNPNRVQKHHQFQVIMKPAPLDIQALYLKSLEAVGLDPQRNDIRFVEDDWESPTLGAWGLGWEVWCNGMEVTQFTYFQQVGGFDCAPVCAELTYGLERLAMMLQQVETIYDLDWNGATGDKRLTYRDICWRSEREFSALNFTYADTDMLLTHFSDSEGQCQILLDAQLPLPAYEYCMKASHLFNLLDARGVVSVTERASYIARVRNLAKGCCTLWLAGGQGA